jgi:hypothetical protein
MMAAEKTLAILQSSFADFPAERYAAVSHAIEAHSFSAAIPRARWRRKSSRMPTVLSRWGRLVWRGSSPSPAP